MDNNQASQRNNLHIAVIALFSLLTFLSLYLLRSLDDTRFTGWSAAQTAQSATLIFSAIVCGSFIVYLLLTKSFPEKYPGIFLFSLSFAASLVFMGEPEAIVDASRYFAYAKHIETYGMGYFIREWGHSIGVWTDLPLVPAIYGLLFRYAGESRYYIQTFTALLFSLTIVLTYLTGKILWDRDMGFIGGLLLMGSPYLYSQLPLMLVDVPEMFFLVLCVYTFIVAIERGGVMVPVSAAVIAASFYVKYSMWFMLTVLIVIAIVYLFGKPRGERPAVLSRSVGTLIIAALAISILFIYKFDVISAQIRLLIDYQKPGLRRWGESLSSIFLFQVHPFISVAAVFSTYRAVRRRDLKYLIIAWLVFLVIAFRIRRIRYIIMVFPLLSLMASYGLMQIKNRITIRYAAMCIAVFSLSIAFFCYHPYLVKDSSVNLSKAGAFLDSLPGESVEVVTISRLRSEVNPAVSVPVLDLFTKKKILYDYHSGQAPDMEELMKSPLRFTWEYRNPGYYSDNILPHQADAIAVISPDNDFTLTPDVSEKIKGFHKSGVFNTTTEQYEYQTIVTVYSRD